MSSCFPPQTIIKLPVHTATWLLRASGTSSSNPLSQVSSGTQRPTVARGAALATVSTLASSSHALSRDHHSSQLSFSTRYRAT